MANVGRNALHVPYVSKGICEYLFTGGTDNELKTTSFPRALSPMGVYGVCDQI